MKDKTDKTDKTEKEEKTKNSLGRQTRANLAVSVLYQIVAAACSLILPRFILRAFGSEVNGLMQSINQLLSYTMLMECGVGGQILASFYKPLADKDEKAVSDVFHYSRRFFNKISYVYMGFAVLLALTAKQVIRTEHTYLYVFTLVLILAVSYYFSYYFALTQRILIRADQKIRIVQGVQSVTLILNAIICVAAIRFGCGIHAVKLVSAIVFLLNPLFFRFYVNKYYHIHKELYDKKRTFPRKRDALVHQIAFFVHMNTDIVLISAVCGSKEVSVYSVYNSVLYAIQTFFTTVSDSFSAAIGNLIAKGEENALQTSFELYQMVNTAAVTFACVVEAILILPFVRIYTNGVTDALYIRPVFAYTMIAAQWFFCMRIPYNNTIYAAGQYRETKFGAYLEVLLNLSLSLVLLKPLGICGVAVGTFVAMAARAVYMAWYLSKHLLFRKLWLFFKETVLHATFGVLLVWIASNVLVIAADNLFVWALYAVGVSVCVLLALVLFNLLVNRKTLADLRERLKRKA